MKSDKFVYLSGYFFTGLVAPKIAALPTKTDLVQGSDLWQTQLFCNATGHPYPQITWFFYKDGKGIQVNKEGDGLQGDADNCLKRTDDYYFLRSDDPRHFVICNPKKEHSGKYQCRASNSEGEATQSALINVLSKYNAF